MFIKEPSGDIGNAAKIKAIVQGKFQARDKNLKETYIARQVVSQKIFFKK